MSIRVFSQCKNVPVTQVREGLIFDDVADVIILRGTRFLYIEYIRCPPMGAYVRHAFDLGA